MNITFRYFLKSISIGVFLLFFSFQAKADGRPDGTTFTFDDCNGTINIKFVTRNEHGCVSGRVDWLDQAKFYYKDKAGAWIEFYDYDTRNTTSGGLSMIIDESDQTTSGKRWSNYTIKFNDSKMKYPFEFRVWWKWENNACYGTAYTEGNDYSTAHNKPVVDPPTNLRATNGTECNSVKLNWDTPTQSNLSVGCLSSGNLYYNIYINNVFKASTTSNTITIDKYSYGLARDQSYEFKVEADWRPNVNNNYNIKSTSISASGKLQDSPDPPSGVVASQDKCDGSIKLDWSWYADNPTNGFKIYRSTANANSFSLVKTVEGSVRSLINNNSNTPSFPVIKQTNYDYKVSTVDNCLTESPSVIFTGVALDKPNAAIIQSTVANNVANNISLTWSDVANNEDKYTLERSLDGGGSPTIFELAPNSTNYIDNTVGACLNYNYVVKAFNTCSTYGVTSSISSIKLTPDLTNTFNTNKKLTCSKGYFNNRVELSWMLNNSNVLTNVKIYRKILGSSDAATLITTVTPSTGTYIDYTIDAGVFYQYSLVGETNCAGTMMETPNKITPTMSGNANIIYSEDIGFRSPTGIINGHIEYAGGIAVKDAIVRVEKTSGASGYAAEFDGNGYLSAPSNSNLSVSNAVTVETWVSISDLATSQFILGKEGSYVMRYDDVAMKVKFEVFDGGTTYTAQSSDPILVDQYYHFTGVYDGINVKLFLNGDLVQSVAASGSITQNANTLKVGGNGTTNFKGKMDEIRVWKIAKTNDEVKKDFERILNGNEAGLVAAFHADENVGNALYDISKTGNSFNANHTSLSGSGFTFSSTIPNASQMGYIAYTNSTGDYTIEGVRYNGTGENFKVTPSLGVHKFKPGNKILFIGDGSTVQNTIDFLDESSFLTTGNVRYSPLLELCTCPVEGAFVLIDGANVVKDGEVVRTNSDGNFSINVPIGEHAITVSQPGHTYLKGRFPVDLNTKHNFQENLLGIKFIDSTFVKVVGRVVGGTREAAKPMIIGRSKNNIGEATIKFTTLSSCYTKSIITNTVSGDYVAYLPPLKYTIADFSTTNIGSPNIPTFSNSIFSNNALLDISTIPPVQEIIDTVFTNKEKTAYSSIDKETYQTIKSWNYRSAPSIWVKDLKGRDFTNFGGDSIYVYDNPITELKDTLKGITPATFGYPLFTQSREYKVKIGAKEKYSYKTGSLEKPIVDEVPVTTGLLTINNGLSTIPVQQIIVDSTYISATKDSTSSPYSFKVGAPSTMYDATKVNFANQFSITFESGINTVPWKTPGKEFKGIIIGGKSSDGQGFVTLGPQLPEMILRDPPGTDSYSSFEKGQSISKETNWSAGFGSGFNAQKRLDLGTKFSIGLGMQTETKVTNEYKINLKEESKTTEGGGLITTLTTTENWSTSQGLNGVSGNYIGAGGDIYIGKSMNVDFGISDNISIVKNSTCSLPGVLCNSTTFPYNGEIYAVALRKTLAVAPGGYATAFVYSQDHIVNKLMPRLKELRNQLFAAKSNMYVSNLLIDNPNYGRNNDDPVFGKLPNHTVWSSNCNLCPSSENHLTTEPSDANGLSYRYIKPLNPIHVSLTTNSGVNTSMNIPAAMGDSVRWYNQQIRLWEEAIARNEKDKYDAISKNSPDINRSFSAGTAYTNTISNESIYTTTSAFELAISVEGVLKIGAEIGGSGVEVEDGLAVNLEYSNDESKTTTNTTTFSYTLSDSDVGDSYSIDINNSTLGYGPIFSIKAGETSCPWEGVTESLYFTKNDKPVILSGGTLRREYVEMKIDGSPTFSKKVNIPSDGKAVFDLEIINNTETHDDIEYAMNVLSYTNQKGAIVTIDGNMPSDQLYLVKDGGSIHKQLVIERGVSDYEYDNIAIAVGSSCGDGSVGDTIYVSVYFLPTCTDIAIANPLNQFVVNNSFDNKLNVIVNNYDINYNGLKQLDFEYKKSAESSWVGLQSWFKNVKAPSLDSVKISETDAYTLYEWDVKDLPDGNYDIRSKSKCDRANVESIVLTGVIDRINPAAFGSPSPADGILDPNDDISIQFNETVDIGTINTYNFDVRGVLNGGVIDHGTSLNLDGTANYLEVVGGANLQNRDFSVEFWAKRNALGEQAVVSQGIDSKNSLFIGFNAANEFAVRLGDATEVATTGTAPVLNNWNHYAVSYNKADDEVLLFIDGVLKNSLNTNLIVDYTGSGKLIFGKENHSNSKYFNGNVHGIRMWSKALKGTEVSSQLSRELNRSSAGLLYDWRMNEADGNIAKDYIRSRNADIKSATWKLDPNGFAAEFNGSGNIKVDASRNAIDSEMDFTLEFWFNSAKPGSATLFSNGKGDGVGSDKLYAWNIQKDDQGKIHVFHNGIDFVATNEDYFKGDWHHFALTMQRTGNLTAYIDGNLENSMLAKDFKEFNTARMYLGTRAYQDGINTITDLPFTGKMDDFRVWNLTRKAEQIKRDKQFRLKGDEPGLFAYLPFEGLTSSAGISSYTASTNSLSANSVSDNVVTNANNGVATISQTPLLKLPRPVASIPFTYLVNNDKIIIQPTIDAAMIENVTLDITVKNVKDLRGNTMVSPKTWISYMNKNQVKWQDDLLEFTIEEGKGLSFTEEMVNTGGALKQYTISNIPSWMSINGPTGNISPNSSVTKTFNVSTGINIGTYEEDILLTTDFGYAEKLTVRLVVKAIEPKYTFDPLKYQYSMNIVGQLKIDDVVSSNEGDKLIAYVNNEVRGIGVLKYLPAYDKYEVFLNVYSNTVEGELIKFNIWNAANGETYVDATPNITFEESKLIGTPAAPETFKTTTKIKKNIPLKNGWTWVSFPVNSSKFNNSNGLLGNLSPIVGDVSKSQTAFDQYATGGWAGNLGAYTMTKTYKIKLGKVDTLRLEGSKVLPELTPITVNNGWNWIGFNSLKNLSVTEALGNYNALTGDILKSQFSFAYYDNLLGWMGSLATMIPTEGYMLKSSTTTSSIFTYPNSAVFGQKLSKNPLTKNDLSLVADFYPEQFSKNMSIIGSTNLCPEIVDNENLLLKVYSGKELRGVCKPQWVASKNDYLFFMTAYSNEDQEKLTFVYTTEGDSKVNAVQEIVFTENNLLGTPSAPLMINVDESENCSEALKLAAGLNVIKDGFVSISPNPFNKVLNIDFKQDTEGSIRLFDTAGKEVYVRDIKKISKVEINFNEDIKTLTSGVYFLRIDTDSNSKTYKIIKQ